MGTPLFFHARIMRHSRRRLPLAVVVLRVVDGSSISARGLQIFQLPPPLVSAWVKLPSLCLEARQHLEGHAVVEVENEHLAVGAEVCVTIGLLDGISRTACSNADCPLYWYALYLDVDATTGARRPCRGRWCR